MTDEQKKRVLHKHRCAVTCPGCGETISEDDDMSEVEYVRTKRATDVFFHTRCMNKVWNH